MTSATMAEPEKPFACSMPDCGMTFTNEDHLTVHTKKHDMYLQLGLEQKAAFVADQTPTPTRFIRNCEEVGLFQDLQNVNPFEEGFKRAMETCKHGLLSLENMPSSTSDDLHTPQMVFPMLDNGDSTMYRNNQKNITISRSSSDESGTVKEYETTTISKLTNQVTTISRVVNKHDAEKVSDETIAKEDALQTDVHNETSVSYTNNVIKIHNNIEIRKDNTINVETVKVPINVVSYADTVIKDAIITKDVLLANGTKAHMEAKMPPIMSQRSLDFVVESLTSDICQDHNSKPEVKMRNRRCVKVLPKISPAPNSVVNKTNKINVDSVKNNLEANNSKCDNKDEDYEVIIKLPNGKQVRMKAVDEINSPDNGKTENNTKEKLKLAINKKVSQKNNPVYQRLPSITPMQNILPITTGTLIPITIVNPTAQLVHKIQIAPYHHVPKTSQEFKKTVKRKTVNVPSSENVLASSGNSNSKVDDDCVIVGDVTPKKRIKEDLDTRVAASRRYRVRLRDTMRSQVNDIKQLKEANSRLIAEQAVLKLLITEHMKRCPNADDLRSTQEKLSQATHHPTGV